MTYQQNLGHLGETMAAFYLLASGYNVVDTNVRYLQGELDLVATKRGQWYFIEVKTRLVDDEELEYETMTPWKMRKFLSAARRYMEDQHIIRRYELHLITLLLDRNGHLIDLEHDEGFSIDG